MFRDVAGEKGVSFAAMAEEEPDYASSQSRTGHSSTEEVPHPFWSERIQTEFLLQQRRPRDLDFAANRSEGEAETVRRGEVLLEMDPPYSFDSPAEGQRLDQQGLVREAVEEVLAENEALRQRVTDLEAFSSARTASTRQIQSSGSRSADRRSLEPDYGALDPLVEEDECQRSEDLRGSIPSEQVLDQGRQSRSLLRGLMERAGSSERWNALSSFLRFRPRSSEQVRRKEEVHFEKGGHAHGRIQPQQQIQNLREEEHFHHLWG